MDIIGGAATHYGMRAAGIVADHATERVMGVCGGIGGKGQVVLLGGMAQVIEDQPGLDTGKLVLGVEREDAV
jgi:hypothetical protein